MKITPLDDRILVEALPDHNQTAGGLYLPDNAARQRLRRGKVVGVGPGSLTVNGELVPMGVVAGDTVLFDANLGFEVQEEADGKTRVLKLMRRGDVVAKVEEGQ